MKINGTDKEERMWLYGNEIIIIKEWNVWIFDICINLNI